LIEDLFFNARGLMPLCW